MSLPFTVLTYFLFDKKTDSTSMAVSRPDQVGRLYSFLPTLLRSSTMEIILHFCDASEFYNLLLSPSPYPLLAQVNTFQQCNAVQSYLVQKKKKSLRRDPSSTLNSSTALTKGYQCHKMGNSNFTSHFCESFLLLLCLLELEGGKQLVCTYVLFCITLNQQAENKGKQLS